MKEEICKIVAMVVEVQDLNSIMDFELSLL